MPMRQPHFFSSWVIFASNIASSEEGRVLAQPAANRITSGASVRAKRRRLSTVRLHFDRAIDPPHEPRQNVARPDLQPPVHPLAREKLHRRQPAHRRSDLPL